MLKIHVLSNSDLRSYVRLLGLVLVMLLVFVAIPFAYYVTGVKWSNDDIPVRYTKSYVTTAWGSAIDNAASSWSSVDSDHFSYTANQSSPGVTFVEHSGTDHLASAEGTVYANTNRIQSVTITIYTGWNWWTQYTDGTSGTVHLYTVVLHEFGHALGLDHSTSSGAIMYPTIETNASNLRHDLSDDDNQGLRAIYVDVGPPGPCKPTLASEFIPGAGLSNWSYASHLAQSAGLINGDLEQVFSSQGGQIVNVINSNPLIRIQAEKLTENLARDMNTSLFEGKGYDVPLTASRIREIDAFLEALSFNMVLDYKLQEFRSILRGSEGRSFWSVLSEVAYQKVITTPALHQNLPNPFNPNTTIDFELPGETYVTLQVYNLTGQLVRSLMSQTATGGKHRIMWDGKDNSGRAVSSGIYIYRLEIPSQSFVDQKKMVLLQ